MSAESTLNAISSQVSTAQGYVNTALSQLAEVTDTLETAIEEAIPIGGFSVGFTTSGYLDSNALLQRLESEDPNEGVDDISSVVAGLETSTTNGIPTPYEPGEIPSLNNAVLPENQTSAPIRKGITAPTPANPTIPDAPTIDTNIDLPTKPTLNLPTALTLDTVTIPTIDVEPIGTFDGTVPTFDYQAPSALLSYTEETYESELQTLTDAWLRDIITNGGTGLAPAVEQAIYDRAVTREVDAARKNIESATDEFAAAGYSMPPGALRARLRSIQEDLQDRTEELSREILTNQAELAQNNTQFAITNAIQLEGLKIQHFNNVANRALQVAQLTVQLGIEVFNARVLEFNTQMEGYKAEVQAFEALVRAKLGEVEIEKAKVDGARAQLDGERLKIQNYQSQIDAETAIIRIYAIELDAAKAELEVNRNKIEVFRAQLDAVNTQLQAKRFEYDAYLAELQGEKLDFDIYQGQLQAYETEVRAAIAQQDAYSKQFEGALERERFQFEAKRIQLDAYVEELRSKGVAIDAAARQVSSQIDRKRLDISLAKSIVDADIAVEGINKQIALGNISELNARARKEGDLLLAAVQAQISGAQGGMDAQARVAQAALQQINYISQALGSDESIENV